MCGSFLKVAGTLGHERKRVPGDGKGVCDDTGTFVMTRLWTPEWPRQADGECLGFRRAWDLPRFPPCRQEAGRLDGNPGQDPETVPTAGGRPYAIPSYASYANPSYANPSYACLSFNLEEPATSIFTSSPVKRALLFGDPSHTHTHTKPEEDGRPDGEQGPAQWPSDSRAVSLSSSSCSGPSLRPRSVGPCGRGWGGGGNVCIPDMDEAAALDFLEKVRTTDTPNPKERTKVKMVRAVAETLTFWGEREKPQGLEPHKEERRKL
ncbi:hypothetical protein Celaphus_00016200 [Cervus elaphus hippelaphus]|uniref:Uncharacterized protein n=1 Tax=Cervus elaphus hippelaphus TaxID=46360 RepID=A0A212CE40_CEREH|nr:hypothetical protein Celaphus_00016200 [Cervus elaphus hippelaphus]